MDVIEFFKFFVCFYYKPEDFCFLFVSLGVEVNLISFCDAGDFSCFYEVFIGWGQDMFLLALFGSLVWVK